MILEYKVLDRITNRENSNNYKLKKEKWTLAKGERKSLSND